MARNYIEWLSGYLSRSFCERCGGLVAKGVLRLHFVFSIARSVSKDRAVSCDVLHDEKWRAIRDESGFISRAYWESMDREIVCEIKLGCETAYRSLGTFLAF